MKPSEWPVVGTALAVQRRYGADRGGYLAASVTYYLFLSLFPLLLLGLSVLGFVLAGRPDLQREWSERVTETVPGLETLIGDNLEALVDGRAAAGAVGLLGLLWSATGITEAAGFALGRIFRVQPYRGFLKRKLWSVGTTAGLGLLGLLGLGVVAALGNLPVAGAARIGLRVLGPAAGLAVDFAFFLAAYRLLTLREGPPVGRLWQGALLTAAGWTALKVIGTWYVARTIANSSAVYGTFAGAVALLLLLYLASQLFLYGAELAAVLAEREDATREGGGRVGGGPEGAERRSTPELVRSIAGDSAALVRKEVQLARQELVEGAAAKAKAVAAFVAAAIVLLVGVVFLGSAAAAALERVLPDWAARLTVFGALAVLALALAAFGAVRGRRSTLAPEETRRTVREDLEWARAQLRR